MPPLLPPTASLTALPSPLLEHIGGLMHSATDLRRLWCVCKEFRRTLMDSWHSWDLVGRSVCGEAHWNEARRVWDAFIRQRSEPASCFARRVMCPWLAPPQLLELFPADVAKHLPTRAPGYSPLTKVWRIRLEEDVCGGGVGDLLSVDSQTVNSCRRGLHWWFETAGGEDDQNDINGGARFGLHYCIPARPLVAASPPSLSTTCTAAVDPLFVAFLRRQRYVVKLPRRLYRGYREMDAGEFFGVEEAEVTIRYRGLSLSTTPYTRSSDSQGCWRMHDGVVAAYFGVQSFSRSGTFGNTPDSVCSLDGGGLCFFDARSGRLLHFMPLVEENGVGVERICVCRPGEMWVLEKWADRLVYYGVVGH